MSRNTDPKPTTYAEWEDLEEERDRLAAELARVRRNHLRRMLRQAQLAAKTFSHIAKQGPLSSNPESPKRLRRAARNRDRWRKVVDALRAALAQTQDGTTEWQA